jgi:hypothetical protein
MSTRNLIGRSLAFAFTLTLAGSAFARRPPALSEAQERVDLVFATCAESQAPSTAGYRDMLARSQKASSAGAAIAVVAAPPPRKMGDHLVLVCAGGEIHQGTGYRGFPARLPAESSELLIAGAPRLLGYR